MTGNNHISTVTINVNGLNFSIKRHRLVECVKARIQLYDAKKRQLIGKNNPFLKVKGWQNIYIFQAYGLSKQAGLAISQFL